MPRTARVRSASNIYHVMMRGNNQTELFYDDEDRLVFLERIAHYKEKCHFSLLAYCLMGNHVHLVIQVHDTELSEVMKRLALSYSHWFKSKYDCSGYLFQGRYKSEPVETDQYLLTVIRYIHNNPVKIGLPITYWTSYNEYLDQSSFTLVDTEMILKMLAADTSKARAAFRDFMKDASETDSLGIDKKGNQLRDDTLAIAKILEITRLDSCRELATLKKAERDHMLVSLRSEGLSVRQIARITHINRNIVERAKMSQTETSP